MRADTGTDAVCDLAECAAIAVAKAKKVKPVNVSFTTAGGFGIPTERISLVRCGRKFLSVAGQQPPPPPRGGNRRLRFRMDERAEQATALCSARRRCVS